MAPEQSARVAPLKSKILCAYNFIFHSGTLDLAVTTMSKDGCSPSGFPTYIAVGRNRICSRQQG